jgi:hypothetical protein
MPPGEPFQRPVRKNHGGIIHGLAVLVLELMQLSIEIAEVGLSQTLGGGIHQRLQQPSADGHRETGDIASMVGPFEKVDGGNTARQFSLRNPCERGTAGIIEKPTKLLHLGRRFSFLLLTDEAEADGVVYIGTEAFPTLPFGGAMDQKIIADREDEVDRQSVRANLLSAMPPSRIGGNATQRGPPGIFYHSRPSKQVVRTPQLMKRPVAHFTRDSRGVTATHGKSAVEIPHPSDGMDAAEVLSLFRARRKIVEIFGNIRNGGPPVGIQKGQYVFGLDKEGGVLPSARVLTSAFAVSNAPFFLGISLVNTEKRAVSLELFYVASCRVPSLTNSSTKRPATWRSSSVMSEFSWSSPPGVMRKLAEQPSRRGSQCSEGNSHQSNWSLWGPASV